MVFRQTDNDKNYQVISIGRSKQHLLLCYKKLQYEICRFRS